MNTRNARHVAGSDRIKLADEVWVATALLHREQPGREAFTPQEIRDRAEQEAAGTPLRPGFYPHVSQHCVANRAPNPGRYRMLYATGQGRRLFRPGDPYDRRREGGKTVPRREDLPARYHYLLDWYHAEYAPAGRGPETPDPILGLRGLGKEIWAGEEPDAYVRRLREGWA